MSWLCINKLKLSLGMINKVFKFSDWSRMSLTVGAVAMTIYKSTLIMLGRVWENKLLPELMNIFVIQRFLFINLLLLMFRFDY